MVFDVGTVGGGVVMSYQGKLQSLEFMAQGS